MKIFKDDGGSRNREAILLKIENYAPYQRKSEQRIADYFCSSLDEISKLSITEIAEKIQTSEASIVRFCKRLGFRGFHEFRTAVEWGDNTQKLQIHEYLSDGDDLFSLKQKVFESHIQTLQLSMNLLSDESFCQAVSFISGAKRIMMAGVGNSSLIASDAFFKFSRIGYPCSYSMDLYIQLVSASQLTENDVMLVISQSGTSKEILELVSFAKKNCAKVISITQAQKSPLQAVSDVVLTTPTLKGSGSENRTGRISQLAVIDALFTGVIFSNQDMALRELGKAVSATAAHKI